MNIGDKVIKSRGAFVNKKITGVIVDIVDHGENEIKSVFFEDEKGERHFAIMSNLDIISK